MVGMEHTTVHATLPEIAATWADDRADRPVLPTARRRGFDSFLVDTHVVDPTAARRHALGVHAPSPGGALLDAIVGR